MFSMILAAAASGLTLTAQLPADRVFVGEPVRVQVLIAADAGTGTYLPDDLCDRGNELAAGTLVTLRDGPGGTVRYRERLIVGDSVMQTVPREPGGTCTVDLTLIYGSTEGGGSGYFLPVPGDYTVRVDYRGTVSAPLSIHADAPTGVEAEAFDALREDPLQIQYGDGEVPQALLSRFPRSRYLHAARLARLDRRLDRVQRGIDPDTGQLIATDREQVLIFVREQSRRLADELLSENWATTDDVRLLLASNLARTSGDDAWADRVAGDLTRRFPGSPGARRHREAQERDRELATARARAALLKADPWAPGYEYNEGDEVRFGDVLYACRRSHVSVANESPASRPALWERR